MMLKTASLPGHILDIVQNKGTEAPFTGEYDDFGDAGTYLCRQCGLALFRSRTKFRSGCGWPSFDEEIPAAVVREPDSDGQRVEILCARCRAHLGHVFAGESYTDKNTRHCVNSLSLDFVADTEVRETEEAIFAAGCFWGVEYYLRQLRGVLKTEVGYSGGSIDYPTYEDVCSGTSGYYEVIRVVYDPAQLQYEALVRHFFEIHDPTQADGQGPDIGEQYLGAAFYYNEEQKNTIVKLIDILRGKGLSVVTRVLPVDTFWRAEAYHQDYYQKNNKQPYCHHYVKRF